MESYLMIPVYFHDESTKLLQSCNIAVDPDSFVVRDVAFFNIDVILPVFEKEKEYSLIQVAGLSYATPLTTEEILDMIDEMFGEEIGLNEN